MDSLVKLLNRKFDIIKHSFIYNSNIQNLQIIVIDGNSLVDNLYCLVLYLSYFNGGIPMDTEYSFGDEVHTVCLKLTHGILFQFWMALSVIHYCAFVKNTGTLKFKSCLRNCCVLFAISHYYNHKKRTLKHGNTQNGWISTMQSQITNHDLLTPLKETSIS